VDNTEKIAALLAQAHAGNSGVDHARVPVLAGLEAAYRVQDLVLEKLARGQRAIAWKVSPPAAGSAPVASPVPPSGVLRSPAKIAAAGSGLLGVEAEVAFRLGADLPISEHRYGEDDVAAAVAEALVLIELCETRLADWKGAPALLKLADFQSHGAFVAGSGTRRWREIDFSRLSVELTVNGKRRAHAVGTHPSGNPASLLPWTAGHCARRGGLRAGDLITTGSWIGLVKIKPGDDVLARFDGIGEARLRLD